MVINDLGMMLMLYLRDTDPRLVFNRFTAVVESVSGAAGIVLAVALTSQTTAFFVLLLTVLAAGMLVIMKYALMRVRLEKLVDERTEELRVQAEEFERQATHDKLTGLPNRRHADNYLQQQVDLSQRINRTGALALADVDHFKRINDRYRHGVGDEVLTEIGHPLLTGTRRGELPARIGGEEFALIMPETTVEELPGATERLRMLIGATPIETSAGSLQVTVSIGASYSTGTSIDTEGDMLEVTDKALYEAKETGRNRVVIASAD